MAWPEVACEPTRLSVELCVCILCEVELVFWCAGTTEWCVAHPCQSHRSSQPEPKHDVILREYQILVRFSTARLVCAQLFRNL
jgi:hypothetical protein